MAGRHLLGTGRAGVVDADQAHVGELRVDAGVVPAQRPDADDTDP
jgi:hypothetical protein